MTPKRELTPRQARFVAAYLAGKNSREASIDAGYAPQSARSRGYELLRVPAVASAIEKFRAELRDATNYTAEKAMAELDEGLAFAKSTNNATALARFSELKMKMSGLLDKDKDLSGSSFQINIVGLSDPSARRTGDL